MFLRKERPEIDDLEMKNTFGCKGKILHKILLHILLFQKILRILIFKKLHFLTTGKSSTAPPRPPLAKNASFFLFIYSLI